ncbi:DUF6349 family protein [Streptomyces sp. NPDC102381]|uniref:DUF6349 family protein n=1 Tax=Streptomyces sp. NPDC102381 TaxID=3366164 RepID=UPI0038033C22
MPLTNRPCSLTHSAKSSPPEAGSRDRHRRRADWSTGTADVLLAGAQCTDASPPRERGTGVAHPRSRWDQLISRYPAGWVDQGAPIVAWRRYRREAHAPPHAGRPATNSVSLCHRATRATPHQSGALV